MWDKRDAETPNGTRPLQPDTASTGCFCFRYIYYVYVFYFIFYPKHPFSSPCVCVFKGLDPSPGMYNIIYLCGCMAGRPWSVRPPCTIRARHRLFVYLYYNNMYMPTYTFYSVECEGDRVTSAARRVYWTVLLYIRIILINNII